MQAAHVLVVEDDPAMRDILADQLAAWGYEASPVADVPSALGTLAGRHVDVVLSDLHLPPTDGFELLTAIQSRWPRLPVLMMSAFPAPDTRRRAIDAGALDFLPKPFAMRLLHEAVERVRHSS